MVYDSHKSKFVLVAIFYFNFPTNTDTKCTSVLYNINAYNIQLLGFVLYTKSFPYRCRRAAYFPDSTIPDDLEI